MCVEQVKPRCRRSTCAQRKIITARWTCGHQIFGKVCRPKADNHLEERLEGTEEGRKARKEEGREKEKKRESIGGSLSLCLSLSFLVFLSFSLILSHSLSPSLPLFLSLFSSLSLCPSLSLTFFLTLRLSLLFSPRKPPFPLPPHLFLQICMSLSLRMSQINFLFVTKRQEGRTPKNDIDRYIA